MANEKRLIYLDHALQAVSENYRSDMPKHELDMLVATRKRLKAMPTVDAVEVVHGRWEPRTDVFGFVRCSVCHDCNIYDDWADGKKWNYCPHCGAKMDGGANHEK